MTRPKVVSAGSVLGIYFQIVVVPNYYRFEYFVLAISIDMASSAPLAVQKKRPLATYAKKGTSSQLLSYYNYSDFQSTNRSR